MSGSRTRAQTPRAETKDWEVLRPAARQAPDKVRAGQGGAPRDESHSANRVVSSETVHVATEATAEATAARVPVRGNAVAEEEARYRKPAYGVLCVLLLLLTFGALGHVAVHIKHVEVALDLGEARRTEKHLLKQKRKLELEVGVLTNPGRILDIAQEKLGMAPPDVADIVPADQLASRVESLAALYAAASDEARDPSIARRARLSTGAERSRRRAQGSQTVRKSDTSKAFPKNEARVLEPAEPEPEAL